MKSKAIGLNHITLSVSDLDRSFDFYANVLGFEPVARWRRGAYLETGGTWIALNLNARIKEADRPDYSHIAFTCHEDGFEALNARLVEAGAREWSQNSSEGSSFYFLDPDGHKLEIHVGNLETRLKEMRENPWDAIEFFR